MFLGIDEQLRDEQIAEGVDEEVYLMTTSQLCREIEGFDLLESVYKVIQKIDFPTVQGHNSTLQGMLERLPMDFHLDNISLKAKDEICELIAEKILNEKMRDKRDY